MEINFKQLLHMLRFMWAHAPAARKYWLLPLALAAGLSRDWVMIVVNKAAASPVEVATGYWLPLFAIAFFAVLASAYVYHVLAAAVTYDVTNTVRLKLINNLSKVQPSFVDRHQHGALYHILTTDVSIVAGFITTFLNLLPSFVFLCIAVPQLFYYSLITGFFAVMVMIGGTLSYYLQIKSITKLNTDARQLDVDYFEHVSEMLWGIRELRLNTARRQSFLRAVKTVLTKLRGVLLTVKKIAETGEAATNGLKFFLFGGIVFLVPFLVKTEMTVTFSLLTFVLFSLIPFEQIISSYLSIVATLVSYVRIRDLHNKLEPYERLQETVPPHQPRFATIALQNAKTSYNSRESSSFVLGPFDFELRHNEIVFLIGHNGSGKTTFMNVLTGLMDLTSGKLLVDGEEIKPDGMAAYRSRISAIFTQFHIFRTLYGLEEVPAQRADQALAAVGLTGITSIVDGKMTRIDLSAGQRRRLALAIALMEDRDILVLDEFVADQDPGQREYFFRSLLPLLKSKGKTIVVSTHDLAWLDCADRVLKFEQGKISEITSKSTPANRSTVIPA